MLMREPNNAPARLLPLLNVSAAGAPDRVGRLLFSQLLFADWTGFGHYIRHSRDLSDQRSLPAACTSHTKRLNPCWTTGTAYGQRSLPHKSGQWPTGAAPLAPLGHPESPQ